MARYDDYEAEDLSADEVRPRVSVLTYVLIALNILAAGAFAFLVVLDYRKRQEFSYSVFLHDLGVQGLPLRMEADGPSASQETLPTARLSPEELKQAYQKRLGKGFDVQGVDEVIRHRIGPQHLNNEILRDHLGSDLVQTLDEEVERVRTRLTQDLDAAANEYVAAAKALDAKLKRERISGLLLPLSYSIQQVEALDNRIKAANPQELDRLLYEAAQRRMLADLLGPLERYRPSNMKIWLEGDKKNWIVERIADFETFKLEQVQDLLKRRFDAALAEQYDPNLSPDENWADPQNKRGSIERRSYIAFLLFTAAQAKRPDGKLLNPQAPERAQATVGLLEYALAAQNYTAALEPLTERAIAAIQADREGWIHVDAKGQEQVTPGFVQAHHKEIQKLRDLATMIKDRQVRLKNLQEQVARHEKLTSERQQETQEAAKRLVAERKQTAEQLAELRRMQLDYFRAQRELAEVVEENLKLESRIRQAEALRGGAP
jgi:hypothetical protein